MTLTAEQLEMRKTKLTASDWAAVMGLNKYRNAIDVFLEKTGKSEPFEGNEYTHFGNKLEPVILAEYAERMGVTVTPSGTIVHPEHDWIAATPDGIVDGNGDGKWGVEAKNRGAYNASAWGESGSDEVPDDVAVQCHIGMEVTGLKRWDVCSLIGGNQLSIYTLEYDKELAENLVEVGRVFWHENVLAGVCPDLDGSESSTNYLASKWAKHGEVIVPAELEIALVAEQLREVRALIAEYAESEEQYKNLIKDFIGEAAGMSLPDGKKITWKFPTAGKKTNWEAVARMLADSVPEGYFNETVKAHTKDTNPSRRFVCPRNW